MWPVGRRVWLPLDPPIPRRPAGVSVGGVLEEHIVVVTEGRVARTGAREGLPLARPHGRSGGILHLAIVGITGSGGGGTLTTGTTLVLEELLFALGTLGLVKDLGRNGPPFLHVPCHLVAVGVWGLGSGCVTGRVCGSRLHRRGREVGYFGRRERTPRRLGLSPGTLVGLTEGVVDIQGPIVCRFLRQVSHHYSGGRLAGSHGDVEGRCGLFLCLRVDVFGAYGSGHYGWVGLAAVLGESGVSVTRDQVDLLLLLPSRVLSAGVPPLWPWVVPLVPLPVGWHLVVHTSPLP